MNLKIIVICIAMLVCCCGCNKNDINGVNKASSEELIEQFFDIEDVEYTVIEEVNELREDDYGDFYRVVINVEQENIADFVTKVEEHYYIPEDDVMPDNVVSNVVSNVTGKELGEKDVFYTRLSGVRRTIEGVPVPKTCYFYIICFEKTTGEYEVVMEYAE